MCWETFVILLWLNDYIKASIAPPDDGSCDDDSDHEDLLLFLLTYYSYCAQAEGTEDCLVSLNPLHIMHVEWW